MTTDIDETIDSAYKDRKALLSATGITECLLGVVSFLFAGLSLLGAIVGATVATESGAASQMGASIAGALLYLLFSTAFVAMGVGTIQKRRWARDIGLATSWLWVLTGAAGMVFWGIMLPGIKEAMLAETGEMPPQAMSTILAVMTVFMVFVYVVLPGLFLLVYRSPHVKATCDAIHPQPGWTTNCPIPVLVIAICLAWGVAGSLMVLGYRLFPVFGSLLTGFPAVGLAIALATICGVLAYYTFRLRIEALWATIALTVLGGVSGLTSVIKIPMTEYYHAMGIPEDQMQMADIIDWQGPLMRYWLIAWTVAVVGYLFWTSTFFASNTPEVKTLAEG